MKKMVVVSEEADGAMRRSATQRRHVLLEEIVLEEIQRKYRSTRKDHILMDL